MAESKVKLKTSVGNIVLSLNEKKAPLTVKNFLTYVKDGFYDGTIFHRVIPNFMVQGGGMDASFNEKKTRDPIKNEADNGLDNDVMTIAMARTGVVDSATGQFFINLKNNHFLNHSSQDFGYAVFGKVIEGDDIVKKIGAVDTGTKNGHGDVPNDAIIIESATIIK